MKTGISPVITESAPTSRNASKAAELFRHLAHHDTLTGLPNRRLLGDRAEQALALAKRSGHLVALLLLDLDDFKIINDTDGHSAGDAVLVAIAQRLRGLVREIDTVSRLGGDEFVILLQGNGPSQGTPRE
ncbi:MAG: GGDEF domain-containing protein [Rhodocyclaceae bacterium]|nr:GGDEF domain-containing protein [Rhodocyclaceae bacterium]